MLIKFYTTVRLDYFFLFLIQSSTSYIKIDYIELYM